MKKIYLLVFVAFVFVATLHAEEEDLEFVLQGIKYNDSLVKDCGVKISYAANVIAYPEGNNAFRDMLSNDLEAALPPVLKKAEKERLEYYIILKGEKKRVEEKQYRYVSQDEQDTQILIQHRIWTYDGEKTRQIYYNEVDRTKSQIVTSNGAIFSSYSPYKIPFSFAESLGVNDLLSTYPDIKLIDKAQVDGHECYLLEGTYKDGGSNVKIWVSPEFGFRPIRSESSTPGFETIKKTDYEKYNGIWAVKHETFQSFFKKSESEKLRLSERELIVNKAEFICAPDEIPDSVFALESPKEVEKIWDTDKQEFFDNPLAEKNKEDTSVK